MRVLISAEGSHEPAGQHYMVVDNHGLLLDLAAVQGALHDPTTARATWGSVVMGGEMREGGQIVMRDGSKRAFFDRTALAPYLAAYKAKRDELLPGG